MNAEARRRAKFVDELVAASHERGFDWWLRRARMQFAKKRQIPRSDAKENGAIGGAIFRLVNHSTVQARRAPVPLPARPESKWDDWD
jgi:hypothetical protein